MKLFMNIALTAVLASPYVVPIAIADDDDDKKSVKIKVFAPKKGDIAGVGSRAFIVDLVATFKGDLASTGASPELTGPGVQANAGPFPGTFSPGANKDHFPSLVVLLSSTTAAAGAGQNLSNLFNVVGITDQNQGKTSIWTHWIVGAPNLFGVVGRQVPSRLFVAIVEGTAPDVVMDMDGNGKFNEKDLELMGHNVISNTPEVDFIVNGN